MKILLQNLDHHARKRVNQYDEDDLTPLHYAARYNHLSVVKLLVQAGASEFLWFLCGLLGLIAGRIAENGHNSISSR